MAAFSPRQSFDNPNSLDSRRSRSFEEREVEYRKARTRIFNNQQVSAPWGLGAASRG